MEKSNVLGLSEAAQEARRAYNRERRKKYAPQRKAKQREYDRTYWERKAGTIPPVEADNKQAEFQRQYWERRANAQSKD